MLFWALQPQLGALGATEQDVGWATAAYFVVGTRMALLTGRLTRRLGERRLFVFTLTSLLVGTALFVWHANVVTVWLGILFGAGFVHFTNKPLTIALINHHTPDESRATVISVFSMVSTLVGGAYLVSAKVLLGILSYLRIVALSFEDATQLANPTRLRAFIARHRISYTVLLGGEMDQLASRLPQATNLNTWPATFFLGRDGRVRAVHAGVASPATGDAHKRLVAELTAQVEALLAEKAPVRGSLTTL